MQQDPKELLDANTEVDQKVVEEMGATKDPFKKMAEDTVKIPTDAKGK